MENTTAIGMKDMYPEAYYKTWDEVRGALSAADLADYDDAATPEEAEAAGVRYVHIGNVTESYSTAKFAKDAFKAMEEISKRYKKAELVIEDYDAGGYEARQLAYAIVSDREDVDVASGAWEIPLVTYPMQ
jgi:transcriptional accessory protein Tex/SPT6